MLASSVSLAWNILQTVLFFVFLCLAFAKMSAFKEAALVGPCQ